MKIAGPVLAAFVALFISAPEIVGHQWHAYGPWFTNVVGALARRAAPSQRIVSVGTIVFTPRAEATVTTGCDGFEGIRAFSILFGAVLVLSWRNTAKLRFVVLYLSAVVVLWLHNLARIVVAIIGGGETHYGTSEMMVVVLAGALGLTAFRSRVSRRPDLS